MKAGESRKMMLAAWFQLKGLATRPDPSVLGKKGPSSARKPPPSDEQPGPPFSQSITGLLAGSCVASTNT